MTPFRPGGDDLPPRRYPSRPIVCVGAVILVELSVVLVRRRQAPLLGRWTLPGGVLELGETVREGVRREAQEETGLLVEVGPVVDVVDHLSRDEAGRLEYHYVITDYLCRPLGGRLEAGDDVDETCLAPVDHLAAYALAQPATAVIRRAAEMYTSWGASS